MKFATKTEIALAQLERRLAAGAPRHCVLADAGYGVDTALRQRLSELGLSYVVGIPSTVVVWPPGVEPSPPQRYSGRGRPPVMARRTPRRQPLSVKALAQHLPAGAFRTISWRKGSNQPLTGRFAAVRVRHAGGNAGRARLRPEESLLIEWPADEAEPRKYFLSNLPAATAINDPVARAHMRWRIEREDQDLKHELGLGHYEGRGWRGFHHHASLTIAAYGFLVAERLATGRSTGAKKLHRTPIRVPCRGLHPARQPGARSGTWGGLDRHPAPRAELRTDRPPRSMSTLSASKRKTIFMTQ